jgi:hypothetical protein
MRNPVRPLVKHSVSNKSRSHPKEKKNRHQAEGIDGFAQCKLSSSSALIVACSQRRPIEPETHL